MTQSMKDTTESQGKIKNGNQIVRCHGYYKFDTSSKSWRGPVTGSQQTLPITRHHKMRERQLSLQNPEKIALQQKKRQSVDLAGISIPPGKQEEESEEMRIRHNAVQEEREEEEEEGTGDKAVLDIHLNIAALQDDLIVDEPFSHRGDTVRASWQIPPAVQPGEKSDKHGSSRRAQNFTWEKSSDRQMCFPANARHHVRHLEAQLEAKEHELHLLRTQLQKAHTTNYELANELDRYTGKHYQDLEKENKSLKVQIGRLQRQNSRIESQLTKIQRHAVIKHGDT